MLSKQLLRALRKIPKPERKKFKKIIKKEIKLNDGFGVGAISGMVSIIIPVVIFKSTH